MTQLDNDLHDAQIADMARFDNEMPQIGIF